MQLIVNCKSQLIASQEYCLIVSLQMKSTSKEKLFTPDTEYVKRINDPKNKSLWQAAIYKDFVGKPYSEMRGLLGGFRSMKDFGQSDNNNDAFLELENTVSETYNK